MARGAAGGSGQGSLVQGLSLASGPMHYFSVPVDTPSHLQHTTAPEIHVIQHAII